MHLFALPETQYLGAPIAEALNTQLSELEDRKFEDGEGKIRPLVSVRGTECFVIQSLHSDAELSTNDKLCRLLFLIATLREHGASRVTAVVPYLSYARKDRQTKSRDPVTTRYVAQLIEAAGCDCVVGFEVHNVVAFQNAFRCQTVHLDTRQVFADVMAWRADGEPIVVVSPDPGGVKRAQLFREALQNRLGQAVGLGLMEKRRSGGVMRAGGMIGEFGDATALVIDDMIASGSTMVHAAEACRERGALKVFALAAHGLFLEGASEMLQSPHIDRTFVTDTIPPFRLPEGAETQRLEISSAASVFAVTIAHLSSKN